MPGPQNPSAADPRARGGQYVTSPGFASPGHSTPTSSRTAPDSTVVYSPKGWRWEEAGDDYSLAVSKMTGAAIESAVRRMRTTFGQVFYIKGDATTRPPFDGESVGDTCRVQDGITLDIVAEWRWTGSSWERMQVDNQQISNLDVGKLTAGSASINEIAARKIASDVGRFLELTTDQLTVTGNASFTDVVARNIWTRIITAQQGEFEEIKAGMIAANSITSDHIQVGALDGQVISGATIQTSKAPNRGIKITDDGMEVYASDGWQSLSIDAWTGRVQVYGRIGRRDTWSQVHFEDIVSRETKTDTAHGIKFGCGLSFESLEDNWWASTVALQKASNGDPSLVIQGPVRKSVANYSPYITVGEAAIAMYTPVGNGSFSFNSNGVFFTGSGGYMRATGEEFAYGLLGKGAGKLWVGKGGYILRATDWTDGGCYVAGGDVVMAWNQKNAVWCNSSGVHFSGTKQFAMPVPGETKQRGGLWLTHSATESPYDGIEYWETVTLGEDGTARWELPTYVPKIASEKAPWIVLTESGVSGTLTKTGYGVDAAPWYVTLKGTPGAQVSVLVKGARKVNVDWDDAGEPVLRDYARESMWQPGLAVPEDGFGAEILGGGLYGPAPRPDDYEENQ